MIDLNGPGPWQTLSLLEANYPQMMRSYVCFGSGVAQPATEE